MAQGIVKGGLWLGSCFANTTLLYGRRADFVDSELSLPQC